MPASLDNLIGGYVGFGVVKFIGYSLFAKYVQQKYSLPPRVVLLDRENKINEDLKCGLCNYNLYSIASDGKCPECGGLVALSINQLALEKKPSSLQPMLVGLLRTLIGISIGTLYWRMTDPLIGAYHGQGILLIELGLFPIRVLEWWLLLRIAYDPRLHRGSTCWNIVAQGIGVSFLLDIPAVFGFCITGGVSIC